MLKKGHEKVQLTQDEMDTISAWIDLNIPFVGEYDEMPDWSEKDHKTYTENMELRKSMEEIEAKNIAEFIKDGQGQ